MSGPGGAPLAREQRSVALDALRGFALLGILLMNIVGFGLYTTAYDDPTVTGGEAWPNLAAWTALHVLAEGKMRCLFSLVFGASVILLSDRLARRPDGADVYYRRMLWLGTFGVAHAYLLWWGDILYPYALCGLALYPFRKLAPRHLLFLGALLVALDAAAYAYFGLRRQELFERGRTAQTAAREGRTLSAADEEALDRYLGWLAHHRPTAARLEEDARRWRGTPVEVLKARADVVWTRHAVPYYDPGSLDLWSMMILGMALARLGALRAERPSRFYLTLATAGYAVGLPANSWSAWRILESGFDPATRSYVAMAYDLGRLSIALGHLGVLMLVCKHGIWRGAVSRFAAIGQTAFSNYILQSAVCAFVFTGYGFGLYGRLERYQLYLVVAALWLVSAIASPIWLRHFRFGPLEWAWRSLSYWERQPMRLRAGRPA